MRQWQTCKHYWKVQGPWIGGFHAIAFCPHCGSWCAVDRDGMGPCPHSMGQRSGHAWFRGEPPLEKEWTEGKECDCPVWDSKSPLDEWLAVACDDCKERYRAAL